MAVRSGVDDAVRGGPDGTDGSEATLRLPAASRAWRLVLLGVVTALFLGGTAVGNDDWWPFGPWRMFATSTAPTGGIAVLAIEVRTGNQRPGPDPVEEYGNVAQQALDGWRPAPLTLQTVGLNRAEVEGRVPQMLADPSLLGTLAATHSRLRPDEPRWTGVRVVRVETVIKDRKPTGEERRRVLVEWPPGPAVAP